MTLNVASVSESDVTHWAYEKTDKRWLKLSSFSHDIRQITDTFEKRDKALK